MKIELTVTGPSVEKIKDYVKRNREEIAEALFNGLVIYTAVSYLRHLRDCEH
jgi:hypothetical protein